MRLTPRESRTAGLFCYDAFFVFKSDVMLTVATQIEAPAKFLWAAVGAGGANPDRGDVTNRRDMRPYPSGPCALGADAGGRYPFSVLGLGDVVVPGAFVGLLRELDKEQARAAS